MKYLYLISIFIVFSECLLGNIDNTTTLAECIEWAKRHLLYTNERHYNFVNATPRVVIFENFDQLNIECEQKFETGLLNLYPANECLIMDNDLDLRRFIKKFNFTNENNEYSIFFNKIKGFNQNFRSHSNNEYLNSFIISIFNSRTDFYLNGSKLIDEKLCAPANFDSKYTSFFGSMTKISFTNNILYSTKVCPYVFMNTNLISLTFFQISNSFIYKNKLGFLNVNGTVSINMNTDKLVLLTLVLAYENITLKLVNKHVFNHIYVLHILGNIYAIQEDLLGHFVNLRCLTLNVENLREFLHTGTKWMAHFNTNVGVVLSDVYKVKQQLSKANILEIAETFKKLQKGYYYPNEDFCLFEHFPHQQMVYPNIYFDKEIKECSCTVIWLLQYSNIYMNSNYTKYAFRAVTLELSMSVNFTARKCLYGRNLTKLIYMCNFTQRLANCHEKKSAYFLDKFSLMGEINMMFIFKWFQYIAEVYLKQMLCLIGIVTNVLILAVLKNKQMKKNLKNVMYQHIFANSVFNLILCILNIISLINVCIFPINSFCSSVFRSAFSQYYKIYFILFLGNAIRLCCNISYFTFSISRFFVSTSNTNGKYFKKFEQVKLKHYYGCVFLFSMCLHFSKMFEYHKNEPYNIFENEFPFNAYDIEYCLINVLSTASFYFRCNFFSVLNVIINIVNNILFLFISVVIDILMINFTKNNFIRKKHLLLDGEKLNEAIKLRAKVNRMIITNGSLFFISHFPEFIITIILMIFKEKIALFCFSEFSCTDMVEIAQVSTFFSIGFQIFVFMKFDRNFSQSFYNLKNRILVKNLFC